MIENGDGLLRLSASANEKYEKGMRVLPIYQTKTKKTAKRTVNILPDTYNTKLTKEEKKQRAFTLIVFIAYFGASYSKRVRGFERGDFGVTDIITLLVQGKKRPLDYRFYYVAGVG